MSGVIVAGMHRSGTSLTTRMLVAGGYYPGDELLSSEREEYLEDARLVTLHRSWLSQCLDGAGRTGDIDGHADWGVVDGGVPTNLGEGSPRLSDWTVEARRYAAERQDQHDRWVAKDPRGTLFLDVWAQVAGMRFVLVYRSPWDVVDSAIRLGEDVFCRRPRIVRSAWLDYNLRLARFAIKHPDRVLLVSAEAIARDPQRVWRAIDGFVGVDGNVPADLIDRCRFVSRDDGRTIASLYRTAYPTCSSLLRVLDGLAGIPRPQPGPRTATVAPAAGGPRPAGISVQVIIPCRNDGDYLVEAVASVDECADEATELTIVDDGSTDPETLRVLDALGRSGRQVIRLSGVGLSAARNAACSVSNTEVVLPLDADNRIRPAMLSALEVLRDPEVDVVHGSWGRYGMLSGTVVPPAMTVDNLVPHNQIDACALIRRRILERMDGWDEVLPFWEDWDLWLRVAASGASTVRVDEVLFDYLVRPGSLSERSRTDVPAANEALGRIKSKSDAIRRAFEDARESGGVDPDATD